MLKLDKVGGMSMDFTVSIFVLLFTVEIGHNLKKYTQHKYINCYF